MAYLDLVMPLLVPYKQQLFYAYLLRKLVSDSSYFRIIAHPISDTYVKLELPKLLGYHPYMEQLVGNGHRIYIRDPPDLASVTETEIITEGVAYRYCVMNNNNYCPLLLAKLLTMKNVVVFNHSDPEIMDFYSDCTVRDTVEDLNAHQLRALANELYERFKTKPMTLQMHYNFNDPVDSVDELPEDQYSEPLKARVTKDTQGAQHLILTPTDGPDSLPEIYIWTRLPTTVTKCQQMLLHRCWLDNRYPTYKIQWVVQSQVPRPEWWTWGGDSVSFQRQELFQDRQYVVIWDLDYYYFPHSTYAKIKLMMDNSDKVNTVGSSLIGELHLESNNGYEIRLNKDDNRLSIDSVIGYRMFRHPYGSSTAIDWAGWVSTYMDVQFNYNAVKINFGEDCGDPQYKLAVIKLFGPEMRSFLNKLYRVRR
jgi:hypothetical protein